MDERDAAEQIDDVEAYKEKADVALKEKIQALQKLLTEKEYEIAQLHKDKEELAKMKQQLQEEIDRLTKQK